MSQMAMSFDGHNATLLSRPHDAMVSLLQVGQHPAGVMYKRIQ
jgi:hypothetical protein